MFPFWPYILDPFQIIRLKELKFSRSIIFNKNIFEMLNSFKFIKFEATFQSIFFLSFVLND